MFKLPSRHTVEVECVAYPKGIYRGLIQEQTFIWNFLVFRYSSNPTPSDWDTCCYRMFWCDQSSSPVNSIRLVWGKKHDIMTSDNTLTLKFVVNLLPPFRILHQQSFWAFSSFFIIFYANVLNLGLVIRLTELYFILSADYKITQRNF